MAALSSIIRNARIIDGTGAAAFTGDIGMNGDRIAAVGTVTAHAPREFDARGLAVAPGFIDIHTHYDPQLCWDRLATPTPEHGVTSIVIGNCAVGLAPVRESGRSLVIGLFGSVEDMDARLLTDSVPFCWESVSQYLDYLHQGLGPNVGVLIGHAVLRLFVMGEEAGRRAATPAEVQAMATVLAEAMAAGALGLSLTFNHLDDRGGKIACTYADDHEIVQLMSVVAHAKRAVSSGTAAGYTGGIVEVAPDLGSGEASVATVERFGRLTLQSGARCSISPILQNPRRGDDWRRLVESLETWRARGARIFGQTQVRPMNATMRLSMGIGLLSKFPTWRRILALPATQRMVAFADEGLRDQLDAECASVHKQLGELTVKQGESPATRALLGLSVAQIARRQDKTVSGAFLDVALQDDLETGFGIENHMHNDPAALRVLLNHPAVHLGAADAGAHINQFSGAGDTGHLLAHYVRETGMMSLERAVQRVTSELADDWGLAGRGRIAVGAFADLVVFDPATVGRCDEQWVNDIPGGSGRFVRHARGVDKVFVNGRLLVDSGEYSSERPGRIL